MVRLPALIKSPGAIAPKTTCLIIKAAFSSVMFNRGSAGEAGISYTDLRLREGVISDW